MPAYNQAEIGGVATRAPWRRRQGSDGDRVGPEVKSFGEFFFGDEQFFFGVFAVRYVADGEAERVLLVGGGRDAVHTGQKPALAGRHVEGIFEFFTTAGDENSVKNQRKRPEKVFADNVGDAFAF